MVLHWKIHLKNYTKINCSTVQKIDKHCEIACKNYLTMKMSMTKC